MRSLSLKLLLVLAVWPLTCFFAQTTTSFRVNYNVGMLDLPASAIESHTVGNFVFAGTNASFLPIIGSITELDPTGTVVWSKSYSGGLSYQLNDIKKDPAGGYYACGGSSSSSGVFLRVDASGNYLDANKFDLATATGEYLTRMVKTSDGGYVAAGYSYGYDPDGAGGLPKNDSTSALIVKFDANGNRLWHRVFRFYSNAGMTNPILNDASFSDVVEVSDGYIFVGRYEVDDVTNVNSDGDDMTPDDAIILKTTTAGAITYFKQLDTPSSSGTQTSKTFNSASKTAAGLPLISGSDGNARTLMLYRLPGSGGWTAPTWSQKYGVGGFLGYDPMDPSQFFETQDGKYAVMGMYISPLAFDFSQFLMKINPSNYAIDFTKKYSFSLAVILPVGQQVSDGGYLSLSTSMAGAGFDYHVIKTDPAGATSSACPEATLSPTTSAAPNTWADPYYQSWDTDVVDNSNVTPTIAAITPTSTVQCITVVSPCTPPAAPTTVTPSPDPICVGQSTTITASGPATNVTYNVYGSASGGTSLGSTPFLVSPAVTTTYYVETVNNSDPTCVSTTRTAVTVTVNPVPTATAGSNSPVCTGQTINLTSNTVAGATYSWTGPNGFTSADEDPVITGATSANSGTYSLTITAGGCSSTVSTTTVSVNSAPTPTTSADLEVCEGEDIVISSGSTSPTATYSWTGPNGFTSTDEEINIPDAESADAGTYTVTVTEGTCSVSITNNPVVVNPAPVATAGSNSPLCEGEDLQFTAFSGGASYNWTGPNAYTSSVQNPSITDVQSTHAGVYELTVGSANGCTATTQVTVVVNTPETITVSGTDVLCAGGSTGSATVTTSGTGPYTYTWSPSGGTAATANNLAAGTYSVDVDNGNGCVSTGSVVINDATPISLTTSSTTTSCTTPTGSASVVASGGEGTYTYSWSPSGGTAATANNLGVGIYTVTVTDGNGCTQTATANVSSANGPTVSISNSSNVTCFGLTNGSATATASGGTPAYTYAWTPSGGSAATASNLGAGTYTITVTDNAGCSAVQTVTITAPPQLTVSVNGTDAGCGASDGTATATAAGGSGTYTYSWTPGNVSGQTLSNVPGGNYTVTVTDGSACTASASYTIDVSGTLAVTVTPPTSSIDAGQTVNLSASVTPNIPGVIYTWTPPTGLSCSDCANPVATPSSTTTYTVTATSADGCSGSASTTINVKIICGEHFIPSIFSPNGDGNNDDVCVMGSCIKEMTFKIFDRWGEKVFESTDQSNCWDGTYKGKPMNSASFVYTAELVFIDGRTISEKGNITLVR